MKVNRDREQELATTVQVRRAALLDLLSPGERKTTRRRGSKEPETFEDHAREIAEYMIDWGGQRKFPISVALKEYEEAINALWTHAQECDTAGYLASTWRQKHRGYAWIAKDDLACEALFKLRYFIGLFKPDNGNLADYSLRGMHQHLTEWAAKQGPIEIPQKSSRGAGVGPDSHRLGIGGLDEDSGVFKDDDNVFRQHDDAADLSYDPYPLLDAMMDGDISDDDL